MCLAGMQQLKLMNVVHNDVDVRATGVDQVLVSTTPDRRASSLGQLVVRDGDTVAVDCVAVGGCPPPSVVLRLGQRDVSDLFTTVVERSLAGKRRSMRRVHYDVVKRHRTVAGLSATTAHDGLTTSSSVIEQWLDSARQLPTTVVHYDVVKRHRTVAGLSATTAHDGLTLRCLATVPGFAPLSVGLRLIVLCNYTQMLHVYFIIQLSELFV